MQNQIDRPKSSRVLLGKTGTITEIRDKLPSWYSQKGTDSSHQK